MDTPVASDSIVQIYISNDNGHPPKILEGPIASVKQCFPTYSYQLYDGESLRAFIAHHFEPEVVDAYDKLRPYAYKADLGRYCLLFQHGGWYADISIMMRQAVGSVDPAIDLVYFSDLGDGIVPGRNLFDVSNSLLYSRPRSTVLEQTIHTVVRHCKEGYYGPSIYSPTGPAVLGAAIANHAEHLNKVSGHLIALTPNHPRRNLSFVLPDGQIIALFKKGWMDPNDVLFGKREGTNNYADLWAQSRIYGEV